MQSECSDLLQRIVMIHRRFAHLGYNRSWMLPHEDIVRSNNSTSDVHVSSEHSLAFLILTRWIRQSGYF